MPAPEAPINMSTVRARQAQDRLRMAVMDAYEAYLISRSRGVRSAIQPAWGCWKRAEETYLHNVSPNKLGGSGGAFRPRGRPGVRSRSPCFVDINGDAVL